MNNKTMQPEAVIEQLKWRYAVKKFDANKKIPAEHWSKLEEALVLSPSSFGLQLWKFIVVGDPKIRAQLRPHAWGQPQITDASHLVVFARKDNPTVADVQRLVKRMAEVRNISEDSIKAYADTMSGFVANPPGDINVWAAKQVYIALGNFMTTAAMMGIDTCPMEGFSPAEFDKILKLPEMGYRATVVCPAGYRSAEDGYANAAKVRYELKDLVQHV